MTDKSDQNVQIDARQVVDDYLEMIRAALDERQAQIMTALPVKFEEYDNKTQTAKVKPLVKSTIMNSDGKTEKKEFPFLEDCPVYFASGGREDDQGGQQGGTIVSAEGGQDKKKGYMLSFPIKRGDEGIAIFSSRTIDKWHEKSDVQEQGTARMHDLADAMILPGVKSRPRAEDVKDGTDEQKSQFRSVDGKHKYGIHEDEEGGLEQDTESHVKTNAKKNVETTAGEEMKSKAKEMNRETEKVETAKAGKAIVKKAPKIFLN